MGKLRVQLQQLNNQLHGEIVIDNLSKVIYATDASIYRKLPLAVAYPKNIYDIKTLVGFCNTHKISIIPRAAGTSLAGQCVGDGLVVDISKHFTKILSIDKVNKTVTVQPGVIRDELNDFLKPHRLFFGPNTSTSNRCMIGGMVGNNSSGTTSIQYGVTRDKVLALKTILSDGREIVFKELTNEEFNHKTSLSTLEGKIYKTIYDSLKEKDVQESIKKHFPKPEIHRRNTGYAIDELIKSSVFANSTSAFNMCKLLSGSEGTLAFTTEITLQLDDLPPSESIMVAAHFNSIESCLNAVNIVMKHNLFSCEMMDKTILDCTKHNKQQEANRSFISGDPQAILMCELRSNDIYELNIQQGKLIEELNSSQLSYYNAILENNEIDKANELRKAGLGLLGNLIGDDKTAACIEDTAVALDDLSNYIQEFSELMKAYNQKAVYYAHAGAGELHLRPILNLKKKKDVDVLRKLTFDVAQLVKKYNGSLSGEHGDGLVRSEYIPMMIGENNYNIIKKIKKAFDPHNIFNPGKIVNPLPLDESLRYKPDREEPEIETLIDFSDSLGILREAEKCNGSGDCRKLPNAGGTMCPSYRATRNEKDTTRARANALREFLTHSEKENKFNHQELKEVFDLCLSCKACSSECPSSVDVAALKAEFQYQYNKVNGIKRSDLFFAKATKYNRIASKYPSISNFFLKYLSGLIKFFYGIHANRSLPKISKTTFEQILHSNSKIYFTGNNNPIKTVYLFNDEFTNYLDSKIGLDALILLTELNYKVVVSDVCESGRTFISKGFLEEAKELANKNVNYFKDKISSDISLIGIEPSAILTFKDEYLKLADDKEAAKKIAANTFLIEEFLQQEIALGYIKKDQFTNEKKEIKFHGHCYQKALSNQKSSFDVLNFPENYKVTIIPSGCCGMAGSFGYEKEHFDVSMAIGNQTLFPAIQNANNETLIAANGTSCRHQIKDGTERIALHPITILKEALV